MTQWNHFLIGTTKRRCVDTNGDVTRSTITIRTSVPLLGRTTTTTIATISSPSWTHAHAHKDGGDCGRRRNYTFNESFVIHQQLIQTFRHICMCVFVMQSIIINENSIMSSREIKMRGNRIEQHQKNLTRQKPDSYDSKAMEVTSVFQLSLKLYATNDPYLS